MEGWRDGVYRVYKGNKVYGSSFSSLFSNLAPERKSPPNCELELETSNYPPLVSILNISRLNISRCMGVITQLRISSYELRIFPTSRLRTSNSKLELSSSHLIVSKSRTPERKSLPNDELRTHVELAEIRNREAMRKLEHYPTTQLRTTNYELRTTNFPLVALRNGLVAKFIR